MFCLVTDKEKEMNCFIHPSNYPYSPGQQGEQIYMSGVILWTLILSFKKCFFIIIQVKIKH